jgi:hypothetical protein
MRCGAAVCRFEIVGAEPRTVPPPCLTARTMKDALGRHWPEYLMEAAGLGLFMMSAGGFAIVLYHPASPVAQALVQPILRRLLMGCAMGLTAAGLIYSPWGKQSGGHFNMARSRRATGLERSHAAMMRSTSSAGR